MSKHTLTAIVVGAAVVAGIAAPQAWAWGPKTQQALVTTAMHVLSKEGVVQITRLSREVAEGATAAADEMQRIHPTYNAAPVRAVETELRLLSAVRGQSIDPYFAHRLGLLGALISQISAPLANEPSIYRTEYYADVDQNLQQVPLKAGQRKNVDVGPYLERVQTVANMRRDLLLKDYQAGIGFMGVARSSLAEETSRSIEAIADIWYTLLTGPSYQSAVSEEQIQKYVADAMEYYVRRGNEAEIDANYGRLSQLAAKTPPFARRLGDIFYDGGLYERAIREYDVVLQREPGQREILERIASYYVKVGDQLAAANRLEQAEEAYGRAAKVDPMHADAERKRLDMEAQIGQRNARQETARRVIEEAAQLQTDAEQLALSGRHADAIGLLHRAEAKYGTITAEFMLELQAANTGLTTISMRLRDLTAQLIQNAQSLSGSGAALDMQRLADANTKNIDEAALRAINAQELVEELARLKDRMRPVLEYQ
jgi:tetratricopeptide (TPR) repeat protein